MFLGFPLVILFLSMVVVNCENHTNQAKLDKIRQVRAAVYNGRYPCSYKAALS